MKTYFCKNMITGETTEKIMVNSLAAAQEYFDAMYPYMSGAWMLFEVK